MADKKQVIQLVGLSGGVAVQRFQDVLSLEAHGMTAAGAIATGVCVDCKLPDALDRCTTDLSRSEYYISGICEPCWDKLFKDNAE